MQNQSYVVKLRKRTANSDEIRSISQNRLDSSTSIILPLALNPLGATLWLYREAFGTPCDAMLVRIGGVEFRPETGEKERNIRKGLDIIEEAGNQDVNILCFPELWTTGYLAGPRLRELAEKIPGSTTRALASASSKQGMLLIGGAVPELAGRNLYDTVFVADRKGSLLGKHRKAHLWGDYENEYFTPGQECTVISSEFGKLGLGVCFDGDFQEYSRVLALKRAKIFFNPSGYPSPDQEDWRVFYSCFAKQNGFYIVCANLVGHESGTLAGNFYPDGVDFFGESRIIDPFGKTIIQSDPRRMDTALYVAQIDLSIVEKAQSRPFFNLNYRRPELYGRLTTRRRAPRRGVRATG